MVKPGVIAFPVLLVLGAITGYLTYDLFMVQQTPIPGDFTGSPYYKPLSESAAAEEDTPAAEVDESQFENVVTISILKGSSVQGAPDFDADAATAPLDALIKWVNQDNAMHTATSGTDATEEGYGSLFDTGFLEEGGEYSVAASELGAGEHPYFCAVHPYMKGTLTVQ
jgi:plastocyanin